MLIFVTQDGVHSSMLLPVCKEGETMSDNMITVAQFAFKNCWILGLFLLRFIIGASVGVDFSKEVLAPGTVRPGFEDYPVFVLITGDGFPSGLPAPPSLQTTVHFPAAMKAIGFPTLTPYCK